jgi:hypothetical protein
MSGWVPALGLTLLIPSGPAGSHTFAIIVGPKVVPAYGNGGQFLLVPICSARSDGKHDPACLLSPGDHPVAQHDSYFDYSFARVDPSHTLTALVAQGLFIPRAGLSPGLLSRAQAGLLASSRVRRHILRDFG